MIYYAVFYDINDKFRAELFRISCNRFYIHLICCLYKHFSKSLLKIGQISIYLFCCLIVFRKSFMMRPCVFLGHLCFNSKQKEGKKICFVIIIKTLGHINYYYSKMYFYLKYKSKFNVH